MSQLLSGAEFTTGAEFSRMYGKALSRVLCNLIKFLPSTHESQICTYICPQPKLVGMTNKKLVQMVSHWTSVILVMLARLAYWTTVKLVMTSGLGKPRQVMTDGLA